MHGSRDMGFFRNPLNGHRRSAIAFGLAALSGFLVFASFPPLNGASVAFLALIPWVWALRMCPEARGRLSYVGGLCCWIPSLWFLSPVTIPGALLLAAYCALYWAPAGWLWGRFLTTWTPERPLRGLRFVIGGAAWWCALESLRGWLLTGFPWNFLGVSQWENYSLIQIASLGGATAVSFVVAALNLGVALSVMSLAETLGERKPRRMHPELYLPILLLAVAFTWGAGELRRLHAREMEASTVLRTAVIQPMAANKWSEELADENYRVLWELSRNAMYTNPDLIIWPETALPEELRYSGRSADLVRNLVEEAGAPLLLGSLDFETREEEDALERIYYNSAFLVDREGRLAAEYRKRHLVMFGEYMPFARRFPFLRSLTPMPEDITPGAGSGVLKLPDRDLRLGMLICFEDLMPYLARDLVEQGADLFVNQTNDAWFDPLWGSVAHLSNAVFRSVEQRRPTVRATNSGVSGWVDDRGVVRGRIEDRETGEVRVRGSSPFEVRIPEEPETTWFYRHPRLFPVACWLMSLLLWTRRGTAGGEGPAPCARHGRNL